MKFTVTLISILAMCFGGNIVTAPVPAELPAMRQVERVEVESVVEDDAVELDENLINIEDLDIENVETVTEVDINGTALVSADDVEFTESSKIGPENEEWMRPISDLDTGKVECSEMILK
jgi:hypothetical protein